MSSQPFVIPAIRFRSAAVWLLVILSAAVAVRCYRLGSVSLWADEYLSMECSAGWGRSDLRVAGSHAAAPDLVSLDAARPWTAVWSAVARDENHPPLYFVALRFWRDAFGDSATAVRALSVVASVAAVGLTFAVGLELYGPSAGVWAAVLMAVAWPQVREAQDARAYMPVTAVALCGLLALARIDRRGPTAVRAAALFAAAFVLPLLHYMALATVGAMGLYAVVGMRGGGRRAAAGAIGAAVAGFAVCWGPHFFGQHQRMLDATAWLVDDAPGHLGRTLLNLATVPIRLVVDPGRTISPGAVVGGGMVMAVPPLVLWAVRRKQPVSSPGASPSAASSLLLLWVWLAAPVVTALAVDLSTGRHSLGLVKYTLAAAPALYLMLGAIAATGRPWAWVPAAGTAAACVLCLTTVYDPQEPDWRPLARFVVERTAPGDPVVLIGATPGGTAAAWPQDEVSGLRVVGLSYYLSHAAHRDVYVLDGPPTGPALAALRRARRAFVLADTLDPKSDQLLAGMKINHCEMFVGLGVAATAVRSPAAGPSLDRLTAAAAPQRGTQVATLR